MQFEHKGIAITVNEHGFFFATVKEVTASRDTLANLKEWIDKQLVVKLEEIKVSLDVVVIARRGGHGNISTPVIEIFRTNVIGVNRRTGKLRYSYLPDEYDALYVLPYSAEAHNFANEHARNMRKFALTDRAAEKMTVSRYGYGTNIEAADYQMRIDNLTQEYKAKVEVVPKVLAIVAEHKAKASA